MLLQAYYHNKWWIIAVNSAVTTAITEIVEKANQSFPSKGGPFSSIQKTFFFNKNTFKVIEPKMFSMHLPDGNVFLKVLT